MFDFSTFNLSKCNVSCKIKKKKKKEKRICVFLGWNSKKLLYFGILHQHTQFFFKHKISTKSQNPQIWDQYSNLLTCKVSSKNKKTRSLGPQCHIQILLGCNLMKTIIKSLISILEFVKTFHPKQTKKTLFGPKMLHFGNFWLEC